MRAATRGVRASAVGAFAFAFDPSPAGGGRGQGEGLLPFLPSSLSPTHNQEPLIRQPAAATFSRGEKGVSHPLPPGAWERVAAKRRSEGVLASIAGLLIASSALAQGNVPPSYGHDFVTVGAPGNRAANMSEIDPARPFALTSFPTLGAVNYSYRITRNEVAVGQWFDFVRAYSRFADEDGVSRNDFRLTGRWGIQALGSLNPALPANWSLYPGTGNLPAEVGFHFAAMYCNWLQNGRPTQGPALTRAAFETGAYAITNSGLGQAIPTRLAGAQYWIPSVHEWVKAAYYDPNRYGVGEGGYWSFSGMSATPLVGGPPGVGQSSAGWYSGLVPPNIGSYPGTLSPWGLLDTSGGAAEFTDSRFGAGQRLIGIGAGYGEVISGDYLGAYVQGVEGSVIGFRVATFVPAPGVAVITLMAPLLIGTRRRRMT